MLGRIAPLLICKFLLITGCARPNYIKPQDPEKKNLNKSTACAASFSQVGCVLFEWIKLPTESDAGSFVFKTARPNLADGSPVLEDLYPHGDSAGEHVAVELFMPSMGHGSDPVEVKRVDRGTFVASDVYFNMHGAWDIRIQFKDGKSVRDQAVVSFRFQ